MARSRSTACRVASASNCDDGRIRVAPDTTDTIDPITEPKQWYSGTGATMRSVWSAFNISPIPLPLLSRPRCVSITPLGSPVVPEVY